MKMKLLPLVILLFVSIVASAQQAPKSRWAKFEGNRVHYYDVGDRDKKTAIVLIHGWTCNADFWDTNYNAFPSERVIAIDLIGHGRSDKPNANYSMEYFARSVDAVLKKAGVKKAVLVGHSMGTPVARQFYRLYPEQTAGLVFVDGGLRAFGPRAQIEKFFEPMFTNYAAEAPKFIDGLLRTTPESLKPRIRTAMLSTPPHVSISAMKGMMDESIFARDLINVPVLAVLASSSFAQQKDIEPFLRSLIPNLELHMWDGVGHFLMMERPKAFNDTLAAFAAKNKLL